MIRVQTDGQKLTRTGTAADTNRLSRHASPGFITYVISKVQDSWCPCEIGIRTNAKQRSRKSRCCSKASCSSSNSKMLLITYFSSYNHENGRILVRAYRM